MFIDFEGIDGSGKTTLSNRLAQRLTKLGHKVAHAREGGELQAPLARRVRELTRDAQLLEMCPQAEFFLNLAREAQQLEEIIKPALARGEICISDRFVYSQVALTGAGRGLASEALQPCADLASQRVLPDLVILVDVDPDLARLRKRLGKWSAPKPSTGDSRKGLAGAGLNVRIRKRFLEMATKDPGRWIVVDNSARPLWDVEEEIVEQVVSRLERRPPSGRRRTLPPVAPATLETLEAAFFDTVDELEVREPALAAFLLSGIAGLKAHQRRLAMLERFPAIVAKGLGGLHDEDSLVLREILKALAPAEVASSLDSHTSAQAMRLRTELFERAPAAVLASLKRNDSAEAWALREAGLKAGLLADVLGGLAHVDSARAWEVRANGLREGAYAETAKSLVGLRGENADEVRRAVFKRDRLAVVKSLAGLDTPLAQELREQLFEKALKVVLRSLAGVDAPYAHALREKAAPLTKEALDSVDGMDSEAAWALRERFWTLWPATTLSSLRHLAGSDRGRTLLAHVLKECPGRIAVLRNAYAAVMYPARTQPVSELPALGEAHVQG